MPPSDRNAENLIEVNNLINIQHTVRDDIPEVMQVRQGLYAPMSRRVMVVGAKPLGASLGEAATGADLGGSSKYSN